MPFYLTYNIYLHQPLLLGQHQFLLVHLLHHHHQAEILPQLLQGRILLQFHLVQTLSQVLHQLLYQFQLPLQHHQLVCIYLIQTEPVQI